MNMNKPQAKQNFSKDVLRINPEEDIKKISERLRHLVKNIFKRRGLVIGLSGGIDSSVTAAISAKALGSERVEHHSASETLRLSEIAADFLGIEKIYEEISNILETVGFYKKYQDAVQSVISGYGEGWKSKIVTPNVTENKGFNFFSIVAQSPDGTIIKKRLPLKAYLEILAATNFKQRTRKMLEYYHADRLNYAVCGTPNRLEYDQGFFVKNGDGAADVKPIAHLYKSQVYQLAEHLEIPEEIRKRKPTTDTYSLAQGQDEFYFSLPYEKMDLCLYGKNNNIPLEAVAAAIDLTPEQVQRVYDDIDTKRSTTRYLHLPPLLVEDVPEIKYLEPQTHTEIQRQKSGNKTTHL
jgi:NAD+ synthase